MKLMNTVCALALATAITALSAYGDEEVDTAPAMAAARAWLAEVDADKGADSWEGAASFFRDNVPKAQWQARLDAARGPLGGVISRKMRSVTYAHMLPGAPPGDYAVIQFDTRFEKQPALETVTPMREKDGSWKVAGYFIR
jgi:hypothetical protein